MAVDHTSANIF